MLFLTSNDDKFEEAKSILDVKIGRKDVDLKEIQAVEIEKVVKHKVNEAYKKLGEPVIVEDTGIFIEDWNRLPGALTKFFMENLGNEKICKMLNDERKVTAETYVCYRSSNVTKIFKGLVRGKIAKKPRGVGFGWDPIFIPRGYDKTFGEMDQSKKNSISMRRKALEKFKRWIEGR